MATVAVVGFVGVVALMLSFARGLPNPRLLETIQPAQESIIYDRNMVELARFSAGERREVVDFGAIPPVLLDATTAIEDKTFWTNTGFDPMGIVAAAIDSLRGRARGASTITQQLVRQRLLEPELVQQSQRLPERKIKELFQSVRVTEAFRGETGKQQIIAAYLNQNFYGNNSYGVKTAARSYFGVRDLSKLTLAQAAILAGLPQAPGSYDLVRNAEEQDVGDERCPDPGEDLPHRARHGHRRAATQLHPAAAGGRRHPPTTQREPVLPAGLPGRHGRAGGDRQPEHPCHARTPLRVVRPGAAHGGPVRRGDHLHPARAGWAAGRDHARLECPEGRPEVGRGRGPRTPPGQPALLRQGARRDLPALDARPAEQLGVERSA